MILICTDEDIIVSSIEKSVKDIKISDLNFPAQIIWDNHTILFCRNKEFKLLKANKPLPKFIDKFKLHL